MIPLQEYKDALGPLADMLTEEEVLKVRDNQDKTAELFFDMWIKERNKEFSRIEKENI